MRVLRLLGRRGPLLLWTGQLGSIVGDQLFAMAVIWLVLQLTGSASLMALVTVAEAVPYVIVGFVLAGVLDRSDRLRALVRIDVVRAVIVSVIPIGYLAGVRSVGLLISVCVLLAALEGLFDPALQALLPGIVEVDDVQPMVALNDSTGRLARVLGPGSAGLLLIVISEIQLFTVDAASFLLSAVSLALVARHRRRASVSSVSVPPRTSRPGRAMLLGLAEARRRPAIRLGLYVRGSCNFVWAAFTIGVPFLLVRELHAGLKSFGFILAAFGAGNLIGTAVSGTRLVERHLLAVYCVAWGLVGGGLLWVAVSPNVGVAMGGAAFMGVFTPMANVSMDAYLAKTVPADYLGRVYALFRVVVVGASALGAFGVAALITTTSARTAMSACALWMVATALAGFAYVARHGDMTSHDGGGDDVGPPAVAASRLTAS
jgi:hypothetical protein